MTMKMQLNIILHQLDIDREQHTHTHFYAALLPRRGPHIASHSVCPSEGPSVCLSVRLSVCLSVRPVMVAERHVAPPSELQ